MLPDDMYIFIYLFMYEFKRVLVTNVDLCFYFRVALLSCYSLLKEKNLMKLLGSITNFKSFKSAVCLGLFGAKLTCDVRGSSYVYILFFMYKPKSLDGKESKVPNV